MRHSYRSPIHPPAYLADTRFLDFRPLAPQFWRVSRKSGMASDGEASLAAVKSGKPQKKRKRVFKALVY